jgi:hypothetical protein
MASQTTRRLAVPESGRAASDLPKTRNIGETVFLPPAPTPTVARAPEIAIPAPPPRPQGPPGPPGPAGRDGAAGPPGADGAAGPAATLTAQQNGADLGEIDTINSEGEIHATVAGSVLTISVHGENHSVTLGTPGVQAITLPSDFTSGDTLNVLLSAAGDFIITEILAFGGVPPADETRLTLRLVDVFNTTSRLVLRDLGVGSEPDAGFRNPGAATDPTVVDYIMASEEEACVLEFVEGLPTTWRHKSNTAAQAVTGFVTIPGGIGGPRAATSAEPIVTYSSSSNMTAERVTTSSTSIIVSTATANQIEFRSAAKTGDVTCPANGNVQTLGQVVAATHLAAVASSMGVMFNLQMPVVASGAAGTTVDVTLLASAPFNFRMLRGMIRVSVAHGSNNVLRSATGGGGVIWLEDAASAGRTFSSAIGCRLDNCTLTNLIAAGTPIIWRGDRSVSCSILLDCVRT